MIPDFKTFIKESIWSDMQDRSTGETVRKEDDISLLDNEGLYDYIKSKYESRIPNFNVDMGYYTNKSSNEKDLLIQPYGRWKPLMLYVFYNDGKIGEICTRFDKFKRWNFNILKQKYLLIPDRHYDECNYNFKISEKDGTITNHTVIGIIDILVEDKSKILLESIWSDMQDRSTGDVVREEDMITTNEDLRNKIQELYKEQGEGETLDVSSLTKLIKCDDFSNIFNRFREVKHIIGIEDWDVSNVKNMSKMFSGCTYFNSDLSKWDVSSVGDMKCMFMGCEKFNCDLSKWDVSNVGDMDAMFWGCNNFNSDLSKWNVSSVGDMDAMFWNCQTFNSDLSKWNVSSVEYMGNMFDGCKNFYSDLSKWNVSKVMSMQYMFQDCENFNSDLSKWDVSNVGNMECMFDGCKSLKKIPSWYRNEDLNESIWSDMQDRSTGEIVREEDKFVNQMDYDEFFKYIYTNYLPLGNHNDYSIDRFITRDQLDIVVIQMPLENIGIAKQPYILTIKINKDLDKIVLIRISSRLMKRYPDISKYLGDKYIISDTYTIKPVSGKITNYMCLDVIDKLLSMVENPLFKRINYEKVK